MGRQMEVLIEGIEELRTQIKSKSEENLKLTKAIYRLRVLTKGLNKKLQKTTKELMIAQQLAKSYENISDDEHCLEADVCKIFDSFDVAHARWVLSVAKNEQSFTYL